MKGCITKLLYIRTMQGFRPVCHGQSANHRTEMPLTFVFGVSQLGGVFSRVISVLGNGIFGIGVLFQDPSHR